MHGGEHSGQVPFYGASNLHHLTSLSVQMISMDVGCYFRFPLVTII